MYATINLPESQHFAWHGPDTRAVCEDWLDRTTEQLTRTELVTSLMPRQIISNRQADTWRWRDGSRVFIPTIAQIEPTPAEQADYAARMAADEAESDRAWRRHKAEQRAEDQAFFEGA